MRANNTAIITALKTLCEVLHEHSKSISQKPSSDSTSMPTASEEPEIHMSLVNCVNTLLKSLDKIALPEARQCLLGALEVAVLYLRFMTGSVAIDTATGRGRTGRGRGGPAAARRGPAISPAAGKSGRRLHLGA